METDRIVVEVKAAIFNETSLIRPVAPKEIIKTFTHT
jgi:hypothetical protein